MTMHGKIQMIGVQSLYGLCWLFLALGLSGCATAPGTQFVGVVEVERAKGDVYVYRGNSFVAMASAFSIAINEKVVADLPNASYLILRLPPGHHTLSVSPGSLAQKSSLQVEVKAGTASFYEYDFVTGPLANIFFIGSSIQPRERAKALEDMKELKSALVNVVLDIDARGQYAKLDDVEAIPNLGQRGKDAYRDWLTKPFPRAFVITPTGGWNSSWGHRPKLGESPDPTQRALDNCKKRTGAQCKVYAIDDRVVWER